MTRVLYLHGFASGPSSSKAKFFGSRLVAAGANVEILDLAASDFEHLTISGQLAAIETAARSEPVSLMGSSMGGYLAALYAARHAEVRRAVLLAPAFCFAGRWRERLGKPEIERWRRTNALEVYHYGDKRHRNLAYGLLPDSERYEPFPDFHQPALIFHGAHDDVVPPSYSERFAAAHPNARLEILDSGHDLLDRLGEIEAQAIPFLTSP
jgi:pimeloyl-ACP methyl ester carboxylesterase